MLLGVVFAFIVRTFFLQVVTSSANYANGININGLFDGEKTYKGPQINETFTRTVEYGRVYDVVLTSNTFRTVSILGEITKRFSSSMLDLFN